MSFPIGIMAIYGALGVWTGLLFLAFRKGDFWRVALFGISLMLVLNIGYFVNGVPNAIAFFVGIYDVLDNLGVDSAPALATCPGNTCSVWGEVYQNHPSWGVAFYDRFANGPASRSLLLYGHIGFNSIVFVLMHWQLARPGTAENRATHRVVGRVSFACLTLGTACAIALALQHGPVTAYGGVLSTLGFLSMSAVVYGCAVKGVLAIRRGDSAAHRVWMIRFVGAMWGAFWLFRIMLFVLGPLLRQWDSAAILTCIWFSAPLGVLIAEWFRTRYPRASTGGLRTA
ncbi:MAG: DUF2306 domain-containing protein [Pseudomonadota bacterium]